MAKKKQAEPDPIIEAPQEPDRIQIRYGETRKLKELSNWPKNPNKMSDKEAADLQTSMEKFGMVDPPIIDETGMVIGGNHRAGVYMVTKGPEHSIPVTVITGLTETEKIQLGLALNKIHGSIDPVLLRDVIEDLDDPTELLNLGFDEESFKSLDIDVSAAWAQPEEVDQFEAPREIKKKPIKCPECGHEFIPTTQKEKGRELYLKGI